MISVKQAYGIARQNSMGIKLDNVAYDLGDSWAFGYGGEEIINAFQPVIVKKDNGELVNFDMPADFERMENAKRVVV